MQKQTKELATFLKSFRRLIERQSLLEQSLFRGESKRYATPLMCGLSRIYPWTEACSLNINNESRLIARKSETGGKGWLKRFQREAYPFLDKNSVPSTELEWHILAQHYGFPTCLLDWTTNPLVALFFAVESHDSDDGYLYCIETNGIIDSLDDVDMASTQLKNIQEDYEGSLPDYYDDAIFIRPQYSDRRYQNQATVLMLPKNPYKEPIFLEPEVLIIPPTLKEELRRHLRSIEITHSFIYPSLEGAAKAAKLRVVEEAYKVRLF